MQGFPHLNDLDIACIKRIMLDHMLYLTPDGDIKTNRKSEYNGDKLCQIFNENSGRMTAIKLSAKLYLDSQYEFTEKEKNCKYLKYAKNISPMSSDEAQTYIFKKQNPQRSLSEYEIILNHAREAMIMAVSIFNDPSISVKSEGFPVFCIIAWNRLLQAYAKQKSINILRSDGKAQSLSYMVQQCAFNLSEAMRRNIEHIITIRDEVEHRHLQTDIQAWHMLYQASCLNFENKIIEWFGEQYSLAENLKFALQFSKLSTDQITKNQNNSSTPEWIKSINLAIDNINEDILQDTEYMFKVAYINVATSKGSADIAVRYIASDEADYQKISDVLVKKIWFDGLSPQQFVLKLKKKLKEHGYSANQNITTTWLNDNVLYPFHMRKKKSTTSMNEKYIKYISTGQKSGAWQYSPDLIKFIIEKIKSNEVKIL